MGRGLGGMISNKSKRIVSSLIGEAIHHNLEQGQTKSSQLGDWLVIFFFYMHAIKKVKKGTYVKIQNDFQNMFNFYESIYGI